MSFNSNYINNTQDKTPLTNPSTRFKSDGIGTVSNQPLSNPEASLRPLVPLFIKHMPAVDGNKTDINFVHNAAVIGLSQVLISGLPILPAPTVLAMSFKGSSNDNSLNSSGLHNLNNIPKGSIFLYYDGNGTAQASFGGDPIIMYQGRKPVDLRYIEVVFLNTDTGAPLSCEKFYLWMFIQTINWQ